MSPLPGSLVKAATSPLTRPRAWLYEVLEDDDAATLPARATRGGLAGAIVAASLVVVVQSIEPGSPALVTALDAAETAFLLLFTVEYALRLWVCVEDRAGRWTRPVVGRLRWAVTPAALVDLVFRRLQGVLERYEEWRRGSL